MYIYIYFATYTTLSPGFNASRYRFCLKILSHTWNLCNFMFPSDFFSLILNSFVNFVVMKNCYFLSWTGKKNQWKRSRKDRIYFMYLYFCLCMYIYTIFLQVERAYANVWPSENAKHCQTGCCWLVVISYKICWTKTLTSG